VGWLRALGVIRHIARVANGSRVALNVKKHTVMDATMRNIVNVALTVTAKLVETFDFVHGANTMFVSFATLADTTVRYGPVVVVRCPKKTTLILVQIVFCRKMTWMVLVSFNALLVNKSSIVAELVRSRIGQPTAIPVPPQQRLSTKQSKNILN